MFCEKCGKEISDDSKFCRYCGNSVAPSNNDGSYESDVIASNNHGNYESDVMIPGNYGTEIETDKGIIQDGADSYRWMYEFSFWKNPVVLITTYKILMLGLLVPSLLMFFLTLSEDGVAPALKIFITIMGGGVVLMSVLLAIAYPFIALIYGGKYYVLFKMDNNGINHIQLDKQFKRAQALGFLTTLLGAASGSVTAGGAGILAATRKSLYTNFKKVKSMKIHARRNTIYLNESLTRNQIYAKHEDFQFVKEYILNHCPKNIRIVEK